MDCAVHLFIIISNEKKQWLKNGDGGGDGGNDGDGNSGNGGNGGNGGDDSDDGDDGDGDNDNLVEIQILIIYSIQILSSCEIGRHFFKIIMLFPYFDLVFKYFIINLQYYSYLDIYIIDSYYTETFF